jgi:Fur family ferric uptake transcriptional regulator
MSTEKDKLREYLKDHGLKMTVQREQILDFFLRRGEHVSPEEVFHGLRAHNPRIGRATVYRTLRLLAQADLASSVGSADGARRFEHKHNRPHHDHLFCTVCGASVEFLAQQIERLQEKVIARYGFIPAYHRLDLFGTCRACSGKQRAKRKKRNNG